MNRQGQRVERIRGIDPGDSVSPGSRGYEEEEEEALFLAHGSRLLLLPRVTRALSRLSEIKNHLSSASAGSD